MKDPKYTDRHRYPNGYRKSTDTDVAATFRRIRREIQEKLEKSEKVTPIKSRTA